MVLESKQSTSQKSIEKKLIHLLKMQLRSEYSSPKGINYASDTKMHGFSILLRPAAGSFLSPPGCIHGGFRVSDEAHNGSPICDRKWDLFK